LEFIIFGLKGPDSSKAQGNALGQHESPLTLSPWKGNTVDPAQTQLPCPFRAKTWMRGLFPWALPRAESCRAPSGRTAPAESLFPLRYHPWKNV